MKINYTSFPYPVDFAFVNMIMGISLQNFSFLGPSVLAGLIIRSVNESVN